MSKKDKKKKQDTLEKTASIRYPSSTQSNTSNGTLPISPIKPKDLFDCCRKTEDPDKAIENARTLLKTGIGINPRNGQGQTPLHIAVEESQARMVNFLLNQPGIDIDAVDNAGNTALHIAARCIEADIAKELVLAGANREIKNNIGKIWKEMVDKRWAQGKIFDNSLYETVKAYIEANPDKVTQDPNVVIIRKESSRRVPKSPKNNEVKQAELDYQLVRETSLKKAQSQNLVKQESIRSESLRSYTSSAPTSLVKVNSVSPVSSGGGSMRTYSKSIPISQPIFQESRSGTLPRHTISPLLKSSGDISSSQVGQLSEDEKLNRARTVAGGAITEIEASLKQSSEIATTVDSIQLLLQASKVLKRIKEQILSLGAVIPLDSYTIIMATTDDKLNLAMLYVTDEIIGLLGLLYEVRKQISFASLSNMTVLLKTFLEIKATLKEMPI